MPSISYREWKMIDYSLFYKDLLPTSGGWSDRWDVFLSAYVPSDRVRQVFAHADASHKQWLIFPEYHYALNDIPTTGTFCNGTGDEALYVRELWSQLPHGVEKAAICIDITGFIRPYLMCLIGWLFHQGVRRFHAIYSEPAQYVQRELTAFSGDVVKEVRQVRGFEGAHVARPDTSSEVLLIGSGYEEHLIRYVADSKAKARKLQLIGFPPLRADMYQENVLQVHRAENSLGGHVADESHAFFASANDPFAAAAKISAIVRDLRARNEIENLYLCPLSTKAHVLGFVVFYLWECRGEAASIIFPFEEEYHAGGSQGCGRIWRYTVELPSK